MKQGWLPAGSVQLAAVGVSLSLFGTVTKLLNIPLLSVTTNVVATAVGASEGWTLCTHEISSIFDN
jgi:hypothetical protein